MKFFLSKTALIALLLFGAAGSVFAQVPVSKPYTSANLTPNSSIPGSVIHEVLTLAAPHFNLQPSQLIRLYYTCGCVTVDQVGPITYRVTYGGIGIQIVIDATRKGNRTPAAGKL